MAAINHVWLFGTWNVASVIRKPIFLLCLILINVDLNEYG